MFKNLRYPLAVSVSALAAVLYSGLSFAEISHVGVTGAINPAVKAQNEQAAKRTLYIGSDVFFNEKITTSENGQAQIMFLDGTSLTLGPSAEMVIDEYVYDPKTKTGSMSGSIAKGVFRLIGGRMTKQKEPLKIRTPYGVAGIRGGMVLGHIDPLTQTMNLLMLYGKELSLTDNAGAFNLVRPGGGISISARGTDIVADASDQVAGILAALGGAGGGGGDDAEGASPPGIDIQDLPSEPVEVVEVVEEGTISLNGEDVNISITGENQDRIITLTGMNGSEILDASPSTDVNGEAFTAPSPNGTITGDRFVSDNGNFYAYIGEQGASAARYLAFGGEAYVANSTPELHILQVSNDPTTGARPFLDTTQSGNFFDNDTVASPRIFSVETTAGTNSATLGYSRVVIDSQNRTSGIVVGVGSIGVNNLGNNEVVFNRAGGYQDNSGIANFQGRYETLNGVDDVAIFDGDNGPAFILETTGNGLITDNSPNENQTVVVSTHTDAVELITLDRTTATSVTGFSRAIDRNGDALNYDATLDRNQNTSTATLNLNSSGVNHTIGGLGLSSYIDENNIVGITTPSASGSGINTGYVVTGQNSIFEDNLPAGSVICECDFARWGFWGGDIESANTPSQIENVHLGTWITADQIATSIPLSGTATYNGQALGQVNNLGANYLAAGNFNLSVNFGTNIGNAAITDFDGSDYTSGAFNINAPTFNGNLNVGAPPGSSNTFEGVFVPTDTNQVGGTIGGFTIDRPNYTANGIFLGQQ